MTRLPCSMSGGVGPNEECQKPMLATNASSSDANTTQRVRWGPRPWLSNDRRSKAAHTAAPNKRIPIGPKPWREVRFITYPGHERRGRYGRLGKSGEECAR